MILLSYHIKYSKIEFISIKIFLKKYILILFFSIKFFLLNTVGLISSVILYKQSNLLFFLMPSISKSSILKYTNKISIPTVNEQKSRVFYLSQISSYLIKNIAENDGIICVGKNNLNNFNFNLKPKINTLLYWHFGVTFNENIMRSNYFQPSNIFSNIKYIELEFKTHKESCEKFLYIYGNYIKKNYELVYFDTNLQIYKRHE